MKQRLTVTAAAGLCVLLLALAAGVAACGGGTAATTAAPTTTGAPSATTTTAAAAGTAPSIQMTPEITAYLLQMQSVFGSVQSLADAANPLKVTDVSAVTAAQIQTFEQTVSQMKSALDGLSKITPPAELAAFQKTLAATLQGLYDDGTKAVTALKSKDQAGYDAAKADSDKIMTQMQSVLESLVALMMGTTASS